MRVLYPLFEAGGKERAGSVSYTHLYRARTRFAKFYNLPELMAAFKEVADIQTADILCLPVPKANFHTEVIQPSELQKEMIQGLAERAEKIRAGGVDPHVDNMLRITNDGRKLALDMRLIQPLAPDDSDGKVAVCARNVFRIWEQTKEKRSAQLVFCDLSTPTVFPKKRKGFYFQIFSGTNLLRPFPPLQKIRWKE